MSHPLNDPLNDDVNHSIPPIDNDGENNDENSLIGPAIISTNDLSIAQWYWEHEPTVHIIYRDLYFGRRTDYPDSLLD
ncbi:hypothetical protein Lepto7375DRAFT_7208 [Leptolyngbya sp. PCC 7375]|nr:hypothetical protein Lepto7375DRAFT_7208 [Leptolyngbya sp. PCC 7375]